MQPGFTDNFVLVGKILGGVSVIVGLIYGVIRWLTSMFVRVRDISTAVTQVRDNHLPHIQAAIEESTKQMKDVQSDVRCLDTKFTGMDVRITETKAAVHTLGESFLRHLESASREQIVMQADVARNKLDIAATKAADKVVTVAVETAQNMPAKATVVVSADRPPKPEDNKIIEA